MNRPSSPDEPADDLLAAARRRLPPDVDVVELDVEPPGAGGGRDGSRVPRVAGGLLAGAVALAGCGPSPDEVRAEAAGSKAHVLDVSRDVLGELTGLGTFKDPTLGRWSGCDDLGGKVLYHVTGRLDPAESASAPLAERVVGTLASTGLRLRPVYPDRDDPVTLEAVRDDINVQFSGYSSRRFVVFDISGPCLEVGDLDRELLTEEGETLTFG